MERNLRLTGVNFCLEVILRTFMWRGGGRGGEAPCIRVESGPEDDVWIPWHKANELPALDRYSKEHPDLNIPDNQRNPADRRQSAPGGRGFLSSKKRRCGPSSTK